MSHTYNDFGVCEFCSTMFDKCFTGYLMYNLPVALYPHQVSEWMLHPHQLIYNM